MPIYNIYVLTCVSNQITTMTHSHLISQDKFIQFVSAGNATVTVKSLKTGNRFTYKIVCKHGKLFVNVLVGSDNTSDYRYLCCIDKDKNGCPELLVKADKREQKSFIAFSYVFKKSLLGDHVDNLEIWHEGRCCRCGRKLTVPESIESGIGPECAQIGNKFKIYN